MGNERRNPSRLKMGNDRLSPRKLEEVADALAAAVGADADIIFTAYSSLDLPAGRFPANNHARGKVGNIVRIAHNGMAQVGDGRMGVLALVEAFRDSLPYNRQLAALASELSGAGESDTPSPPPVGSASRNESGDAFATTFNLPPPVAQAYVACAAGDSKYIEEVVKRFAAAAIKVVSRHAKQPVSDINDQVDGSHVMVVIVGPSWNDLAGLESAAEISRLCREINRGLETKKPILLALIDNVQWPPQYRLPDDIKRLVEQISQRIASIENADDLVASVHQLAEQGVANAFKEDASIALLRMLSTKPGPVIGDYTIKRLLGKGGFAEVYLAEKATNPDPVALKIPRHLDAVEDLKHVVLMLQEAQTARKFKHDRIVRLFEHSPIFKSGMTDKEILTKVVSEPVFLAYEYVEGPGSGPQTLRDVQKGDRLSWTRVAELMKDVAEATSEIHKKEMCHRDLKPENVLIDKSRRAKVTDFGIAANVKEPGRFEGAGTPLYAPPEFFIGTAGDSGASVDVWAIGVMLFELITGVRPFNGLHEVINGRLPAVTEVTPGVPEELARITEACLMKNAKDRVSAQAVFEGLSAWLKANAK